VIAPIPEMEMEMDPVFDDYDERAPTTIQMPEGAELRPMIRSFSGKHFVITLRKVTWVFLLDFPCSFVV